MEDTLWAGLTDSYAKIPMALTAEKLAEQYGISRELCDEFALTSQQRWAAGTRDCHCIMFSNRVVIKWAEFVMATRRPCWRFLSNNKSHSGAVITPTVNRETGNILQEEASQHSLYRVPCIPLPVSIPPLHPPLLL